MKNSFNQAEIANPEEVKGGTFFFFSKGYSYGYKSYDDKGKFNKGNDDKGYDDKKGNGKNKKGYSRY